MRVIALGWTQFYTPWSSTLDSHVGTKDHLLNVLSTILVHEDAVRRRGELPTEASPPVLQSYTLKVLGTPTCDISIIEREMEVSLERLKAAAEEEQRRRVAACITDDIQDIMPLQAPPMTSDRLLNKRLEILWGAYVLPDGSRTKIWWPL